MNTTNEGSAESPSPSLAALNRASSSESSDGQAAGGMEMDDMGLSIDGRNPKAKKKSAGQTAALAKSTLGAADEMIGAAGPSAPAKHPAEAEASQLKAQESVEEEDESERNTVETDGLIASNSRNSGATTRPTNESVTTECYCMACPSRKCSDYSPKEKIRLGVASLFILLLITAAVVWLSSGSSNNSQQQVLSEFYKANIDGSVKPCDDFYQFACKKLAQSFQAKNVSKLNTQSDILDRNLASFEQLLSQPVNSSHPTPLDQLKIFYQSCMDEDKIAAEGTGPLLQLLRDVGGWSLLDRENNSSESWIDVVRRANEAGFRTTFPFRLDAKRDSENPTKFSMRLQSLFAGTSSLPEFNRRVKYMLELALLLHVTVDGELVKDLQDCVSFETAVFKASNFSQTVPEKTYAAQVLLEKSSSIAWSQYFRAVFASSQVTITGSDSVTLVDPDYDSRIAALLEETPVEVVRNYLVWRLIDGAIDFLPKKFRAAKRQFANQTAEKPRGRVCLQALHDNAKLPEGYVYALHFLDKKVKREVQVMFRKIEAQAYEYLKEVAWMDNVTKAAVVERLKSTGMIVGYDDGSLDYVEKLAAELKFEANGTTLDNYRRLAGFYRNERYRRFRITLREDNMTIPFQYAMQADAGYLDYMNSSYVFAKILQRPFFDLDQPNSLNFGGIGFVLAHKLAQVMKILSACQNQSCESHPAFDCTKSLYNNYPIKQVNKQVNGSLRLEENIGDAIGLTIAYRTYDQSVSDASESSLPDIEYTPRQMWWINAAIAFCSYATDEILKKDIAKTWHSPVEARVNVGFANNGNFARDFGCATKSKMNPVDRCFD